MTGTVKGPATYYPDDVVSQQYGLAKALRNQPSASSWAGVLAQGLGALGGNIVQGSANGALMGNQSMRSADMAAAGGAGSVGEMNAKLLASQVPELQSAGLQGKMKALSDDPHKTYRIRAEQALQNGMNRNSPEFRQFVLTGQLQDPLDTQYKQAQIARLQREPSGGPKPPPGYAWDAEKEGHLKAIPGGPGEYRSFTEGQTKDAGYAARMLRAEDNLSNVTKFDAETKQFKGYDPTRKANAYFPDEASASNLWTANLINSKNWQRYMQASRESMAALLRKDTGAAVTAQEFDLYFPMYYPQPGDGPDVVAQKQAARQEIAKGLAIGSGGVFERAYPERSAIMRNGPQNVTPAIPPSAVEALRANPELKADFEAKYGVPATQFLGR